MQFTDWDNCDVNSEASSVVTVVTEPKLLTFDIAVAQHRASKMLAKSVVNFRRLQNGWKASGSNADLKIFTDFCYLQNCKKHHRRTKRAFLTPQDIMDEWLRHEWVNVTLMSESYDDGLSVAPML